MPTTDDDKPTSPPLKCGMCNHARSFHRGGVDRCFVAGCACDHWLEPEQTPDPGH